MTTKSSEAEISSEQLDIRDGLHRVNSLLEIIKMNVWMINNLCETKKNPQTQDIKSGTSKIDQKVNDIADIIEKVQKYIQREEN